MSHSPLRPPTLHLVIDTDTRPARYGVMASLLTQALGDHVALPRTPASHASPDIAFGHLPFCFDTARYADAVQHVALSGDLLPSGLLWYERLNARPAPQPRSLTAWLDEWFETDHAIASKASPVDDGVLAIHPGVNMRPQDIPQRIAQARATMQRVDGVVQCYRVADTRYESDTSCGLVPIDPADAALFAKAETARPPPTRERGTTTGMLPWRALQDRYGRWHRVLAESSAAVERAAAQKTIRIAFIGTEAEQRDAYPGTLAALGDAADTLGLTLDVRYVAPYEAVALVAELHELQHRTHGMVGDPTDRPAQNDPSKNALPLRGIVLPGGADMQRVAGQIAAAGYGWTYRLPTLGLCLGMQTMATAALQRVTGRLEMTLLELAPDTPVPSFVRNADDGHRLGLHPVVSANDAADAGQAHDNMYDGKGVSPTVAIGAAMRCNHRFRLNPALYATLTAASIGIIAWDRTGTIVDGIAAMREAEHPFYAGAQGHPELMSLPGQPHPLILSWLRAVTALDE
jgi:CTP synthase